MVRKLIVAAAAAVVLPLLGLGAASAAPAAPAVLAHTTNCDVTTTFCNFLANYTGDWWAYGTNANQGIIADVDGFSSQYWYRSRETGWGVLEVTTGACLQYIPATGQTTPSSCSSGTSNTKELFHIASGPSGSSEIENYYLGTGDHFWIDNVAGVYIQFTGPIVAGDELYFRA